MKTAFALLFSFIGLADAERGRRMGQRPVQAAFNIGLQSWTVWHEVAAK